MQQPPGAAAIEFQPGEHHGSDLIAPRLPQDVTLAEEQRLDLLVYVRECPDQERQRRIALLLG